MSIWFYYFEMLANQHCSSNICRSQYMLESKQENVSGVRFDDLTAVNPKDSSLLAWECNALSLGKQLQTYVRIAVPSKCWDLFTQ